VPVRATIETRLIEVVGEMPSRLYERTSEISVLDDAVTRLEEGRGTSLLLEGRAGRGKSTLVEYAVRRGRERGARTWLARARHLSSAAPFEVLRRLLGPAVEESGGVDALEGAARFAIPLFTPGADLSHGVGYGCQWLIAWLAERSPLVLAIDDAHWADGASLQVLLDVQADISVQPVVMLVASRPVENPEIQRLLAAMAAAPDCQVLSPATLSREAVAEVVNETLGQPASNAFVDECLKVTRGNAFYLHELLRPYQSDVGPTRQTFVSNGTLSLRRTVAWRLGELGSEATLLGQAAAVLGDGCSLHLAAELAGLDDETAVHQASRLEVASILQRGDPVEFLHPLLRAAVEAELPEVVKGELHARAARLLWLSREPPESVALHLVNSPGSGDAEVAAFLAEEGEAALEAGSVALATQLLHRALQEPAPADARPRILVALGRAEHALGQLDASRRHLEAVMEADNRAMTLTAAAELFEVLLDAGQFAELGRLHQRVVELSPTGASLAEVRLQAQLLADVIMAIEPDLEMPPGLVRVDTDVMSVERDIDRYLLVYAAIYERTMQDGTTQRLVNNLRRAVAALDGVHDGTLSVWDARVAIEAATFLADDELAEADGIIEDAAPSISRLRGSAPVLHLELEHRRVMSALAKGDFDDALAAIALMEQRTARSEMSRFTAGYRFVRGWVALQRGDYAKAGELLVERTGENGLYPALGAMLSGEPERALDMLAAQHLSIDVDDPVTGFEVELDPHLIASHTYDLLGDRDNARREALREVAIRRRYGPRFRLAQALRRQASFEPARRAVQVLAEALELAESTPRRPVTVRVLASYGAALRRVERVAEARETLYRAVDMAGDMGMARLRDRTHRELVLAGGRPRRTRATGPQSLTAAQQQVARLAVAGRSNRQIAEELFVTIKTVETHLAAVYRKLGIAARVQLVDMLGGADEAPWAAASATVGP
jgi:DNA-binding CsgD family transcriptional regulator